MSLISAGSISLDSAFKVCLTQLIIIQAENYFRSFLSIAHWFDKAKKPSHATVPLTMGWNTIMYITYIRSLFIYSKSR